jgi:TatD DNase family protein
MLFPLYGRREGVRLALGLHPLEVASVDLQEELRLFASYSAHTSYIGEIGLDLSSDGRASRAAQEAAFDAILATDGVREKVATVHSRGASKETVARLVEARARRVIMHWFSGPQRDVDTALEAGFYFSINPQMMVSKRGATVISSLPRDRVLLESDGPYARVGGRVAEPTDVATVVGHLAGVWSKTRDEVIRTLDRNLRALCSGLSAPAPSEQRERPTR